ncbi:MAG: hypothetical protein JWO02_390 [Solirubrobacterales bacterium]|nr:hypothetical protein [Solirubrobacterales bacterium]
MGCARPDQHARSSRGTVRLLLATSLLLLGALSIASSADAYKFGPYRLAKTHLTYFTRDAALKWPVSQAARAWNGSGAHVHFARTTSQAKANVVIGFGSGPSLPRPAVSLIHYTNQGMEILPTAVVVTDAKRDKYNLAEVVAHEFGHVLGLAHTRGCALMNPSFACESAPAGHWFCRILQPDDVRGVIRRYGGTVHLRTPATCPRDDAPPPPPPPLAAPTMLSATPDSTDPYTVVVGWANANSPRLGTVAVDYKLGGCPVATGEQGQATLEVNATGAGAAQSLSLALQGSPPGRYCIVVSSIDRDGTVGPPSAPVFVDLPPPISG